MKRQLHLNLFIHSRGHHEASWRHPASSPLPLTDIRYYQDLAQRAEAALFDSIFLADQLALGERRGAGGAHLARADHRAGGAGGGDQPDRADRHRLDHLYRAVQPGAAVRLDRPHQQRPRRLEHRHLVAGDGGAQFRRRRPGQPRRPLCPRRGVHGGGQGAVGQLGRRRGDRRPRRRRSMPAPTASGRSTTAAISTRSPGRSTCRAARRGGRCWCRRVRPIPAAALPRAMPRRCSPRIWRRRRRRNSTPI